MGDPVQLPKLKLFVGRDTEEDPPIQISSSKTQDNRGVGRAKRQSQAASPQAAAETLSVTEEFENEEEDDSVDGDAQAYNTPPSSVSPGSSTSSHHICVCQPAPKIRRPRNAFILYRQHNYPALVAQEPSLSNPEISKVLGKKWRAEPEDVKEFWHALARKEKDKHQELYPNYRYTPRRGSKFVLSPVYTSIRLPPVDGERCAACLGRRLRIFGNVRPPPTSPAMLPARGESPSLSAVQYHVPPISALSTASTMHRNGCGPANFNQNQLAQMTRENPAAMAGTKRRLECEPRPPPTHSYRQEGRPHPQRHCHTSTSRSRPSYPPPDSSNMGPPRSTHSDKTCSTESGAMTPGNIQDSPPRTVEEVLEAIPYDNKIKLLGRITPPYQPSASASTASRKCRGAIIAVEGDDFESVQVFSGWLQEHFTRQSDFSPALAKPPSIRSSNTDEITFADYLTLIRNWHDKSKEMIKYITRATPRARSRTPDDDDQSGCEENMGMVQASSKPSASARPIIILPTFQLYASTVFATQIRVRDNYSPLDHWQWMATMWRGVVGPDLTVYVKTYDVAKGQVGGKPHIDESHRCLTIYKSKGDSFVEANLRRAGFEITEWLEGMH